jgi:hypothetical protein
MKKFLVLYKASASAAEQMAKTTPEQMKAGMGLWMAWSAKAAGAIVDLGAPLGNAETSPDGAKADSSGGFVGGFSILQGENIAAIHELMKDHPHFHAPGATIEVRELRSMTPGR